MWLVHPAIISDPVDKGIDVFLAAMSFTFPSIAREWITVSGSFS